MNRSLLSASLLGLALLAISSPALAQDGAEHQLSLTLSPVHLAFPVVEVTGEYAYTRQVGLAAIVGVGNLEATSDDGTKTSIFLYELGVQGRYYILGDFEHGLQLGVEALHVGASGETEDSNISSSAAGLAIGPFVGYKFVASFGLTVDIQGGVQYVAVGASASDGEESASASNSDTIPLLNLNLGWSF